MKTPLHDAHTALGARMVDFAGWDMPVQYAGIIDEHLHTRRAASLFDVCHMTEFRVSGPGAGKALRAALACRLDGLARGRCRYGFLLNEDGGILDDLICYHLDDDEYMVVANAGRRDVDARVIAERMPGGVAFEDASDATAKIDLQGPESLDVLDRVTDGSARALRYYGFAHMDVAGVPALVSRTGYTGELGFELYVDVADARALWDALLAVDPVKPAGLGARGTLRLEVGYPLYGHELSEDVTPLEAGFGWALPLDARYVGAAALARKRAHNGIQRALVGIRFEGRRAAREGCAVFAEGEEIGVVTSGCYAPSLECAVALAYIPPAYDQPEMEVEAEVRGSRVAGQVVPTPFYTEGSVRG